MPRNGLSAPRYGFNGRGFNSWIQIKMFYTHPIMELTGTFNYDTEKTLAAAWLELVGGTGVITSQAPRMGWDIVIAGQARPAHCWRSLELHCCGLRAPNYFLFLLLCRTLIKMKTLNDNLMAENTNLTLHNLWRQFYSKIYFWKD